MKYTVATESEVVGATCCADIPKVADIRAVMTANFNIDDFMLNG